MALGIKADSKTIDMRHAYQKQHQLNKNNLHLIVFQLMQFELIQ